MTALTKCDACGQLSNHDPWCPDYKKYVKVTVGYQTQGVHTHDYCSYECTRNGMDELERIEAEAFRSERQQYL